MLEIKVTVDIPQLNDVCAMLAGRVATPQVYQKPESIIEELMPGVTHKVKAPTDVSVGVPAIPTAQAQPVQSSSVAPQQPPAAAVPVQMQVAAPQASVAPPVMPETPAQTVPTAATTYTMDQLAIAATQLMDAGRRNDVVALLSQFSVQALTLLPKEQYGAFATKLRELGAKI